MAHAWKACWVKALGGSNPPSSAKCLYPTPKQVTVTNRTGTMRTRREVVRRRRHERQFLVFGVIVGVLIALAAVSLAIYQGRIESPIQRAITSPSADVESMITLPCPPADLGNGENLPLPPTQVAVRVLNGSDISGLAGNTLSILVDRGYVSVGAANWYRTYDKAVRIQFGVDGLRQAYSVAANFPDVELVLDTRDGALVDIILGPGFDPKNIRPQYAPELDPTTELTAPGRCVPVDIADPEPAPNIIPADPLAVTPSPSPGPTPSPEAPAS